MSKINKRRQPHNSTRTQRESWDIFQHSKGRRTQEKRVLLYLFENTANSRQLSNSLKIDRTSITRTVRNLLDEELILIVCEAKCPVTGRQTQFYTVNKEYFKSDSKDVQGKIFNQEDEKPSQP